MSRAATLLARALRARHKRLLIEAGIALVVARLAVHRVPFRAALRLLRVRRRDRHPGGHSDAGTIDCVDYAVATIAGRLPWRSTCLVRSVALTAVLTRHAVPCTLCLGLSKDGGGRVIAHAWVQCSDRILSTDDISRFAVIAAFSSAEGW